MACTPSSFACRYAFIIRSYLKDWGVWASITPFLSTSSPSRHMVSRAGMTATPLPNSAAHLMLSRIISSDTRQRAPSCIRAMSQSAALRALYTESPRVSPPLTVLRPYCAQSASASCRVASDTAIMISVTPALSSASAERRSTVLPPRLMISLSLPMRREAPAASSIPVTFIRDLPG